MPVRPLVRIPVAGIALLVLALVVSACAPGGAGDDAEAHLDAAGTPPSPGAAATDPGATATDPGAAPEPPTSPSPSPTPVPYAGPTRPDWLGQRPLPLRPDGFGEMRATPPELADRRFAPIDLLPPPEDGGFHATIEPVPDAVLERSTWHPDCPVGRDELRYVTVSFWGFDDRAHTGELLVHRRSAEGLVTVFERLFDARFPIEEMRVVEDPELDAPPTGDGNNTSAFVCRPVTGSRRSWSEHAYGLAIDVNPFHNPYVKGDVVLPELASVYTDRDDVRPGMIVAGDVVTAAFAGIGWGWGGAWESLDDPQHFSESGR